MIIIHEIQVTFHTNYFERLILESWFTKLAKWILLSRYEQLRNPAIDLLTIFFSTNYLNRKTLFYRQIERDQHHLPYAISYLEN